MDNKKLLRIISTTVILIAVATIDKMFSLATWQSFIAYLIPYLLIGYDVISEAVESIFKGKVFNEDFLMCIATIGALLIGFLPNSEHEFLEAVFVMLFFQIGEMFEEYAEGKSRNAISNLMDIRPDTANVLRNGEVNVVSPETVAINETIIIKPGEKIPLDGIVIDGTSSLNTVALTGESIPREVEVGDEAYSGCVNLSGLIKLRVTKTFTESTASKIINLVENASENKSKSETFIAKFSKIYTPIVVCVALLLAFLPPVFYPEYAQAFSIWLNRALTFLVVSCPCALVISVPLTFFGGIGGASKNGILIKGSNYVETLAKTDIIAFDKTGTLTKGRFEVEAVHPDNLSEMQLLHLAAHVERYSTHPIAVSLRNAFPNENDNCNVADIEEVAGQGVRAKVNGHLVCVGNSVMMDAVGAKWHPCHKVGTIIHLAFDGEYAGHIVVSDTIKEDSQDAIVKLKKMGISRTVMLTGDRKAVGEYVANNIHIDECHTELLPQDKVRILKELITGKSSGKSVAFVGDGINDAPVLALADVGIAMGGLGSDVAIEAADVVLMDDKPSKIATAIKISRHTIAIAKENAWLAIAIKLIVLALASIGLATMWMAVFADVGVTVLAIFNAMRTLRK